MNKHKFEIEVLNISDSALQYRYIIVRYADGAIWYYGADNNKDKAQQVAETIGNGFVIENKNI